MKLTIQEKETFRKMPLKEQLSYVKMVLSLYPKKIIEKRNSFEHKALHGEIPTDEFLSVVGETIIANINNYNLYKQKYEKKLAKLEEHKELYYYMQHKYNTGACTKDDLDVQTKIYKIVEHSVKSHYLRMNMYRIYTIRAISYLYKYNNIFSTDLQPSDAIYSWETSGSYKHVCDIIKSQYNEYIPFSVEETNDEISFCSKLANKAANGVQVYNRFTYELLKE